MGLLGRSSAVGLELDTGEIRAAVLRGGSKRPVLGAVGSVSIPEDAMVAGVVKDRDTVTAAIRKLWSNAGIGERSVVLGMSTPGMLMRSTTFPKVPEDRLHEAVHLQAGEYFPIPMNQLVMDFSVLGETETEDGEALELLMVAARREQLHNNLDCVSDAGLNCEVIDASPLVLARHLPVDTAGETAVVADIANGLTSMIVVQ
ncbi:MAG: type IV pilus biogenesis protein PilM, partial [Clostridia bacterium]